MKKKLYVDVPIYWKRPLALLTGLSVFAYLTTIKDIDLSARPLEGLGLLVALLVFAVLVSYAIFAATPVERVKVCEE